MGSIVVRLLTAVGPFLALAALKAVVRDVQSQKLPQQWQDEQALIVEVGNKILAHFGESPVPPAAP